MNAAAAQYYVSIGVAHENRISDQAVADAVKRGLFGERKSLPSWLFYDQEGDRLFQQIMRMPEYYLTRCEYDILKKYKDELLESFRRNGSEFRLIELGAGDGLKSEILLDHFVARGATFTYTPVDISGHVLDLLVTRLRDKFPELSIDPQNKSYDQALSELRQVRGRKVILFMGANIGNFTVRDAVAFLKQLALPLRTDDRLLVGFDLKKDPRVIQEAYDDPRGITANFNLNILERLNRELDARFDPDAFSHFPYYDPETGTTKSFLVSRKEQSVYIGALDRTATFRAWETVQTEVSQKYDIEMIHKVLALADLGIDRMFTDANEYFADVLISPR